jgi:hypothetical protein
LQARACRQPSQSEIPHRYIFPHYARCKTPLSDGFLLNQKDLPLPFADIGIAFQPLVAESLGVIHRAHLTTNGRFNEYVCDCAGHARILL